MPIAVGSSKPRAATAEITHNIIKKAKVEFGLSFPASFLLRIVIAVTYRNSDAGSGSYNS